MNPERWEKIHNLFSEALELDAEKRNAFLKRNCADDSELENEIIKLLNAHESAENFMNKPPVEMAFKAAENLDGDSIIGCEIGVYRIESRIGQGGMGTVYLAGRADEQFEKKVAVKLLKRGMDTEEIVRRFKYERQILANLVHPNIAGLYDGGTSEDGLPFFVMEYVEGLPLNEYCEKNELDLTERLKLFCTICSAVSYAHQNLVVHRDIKPSNILVTKDGVPKLLDFGIAKVLQAESDQNTLTVAGEKFFTPDFASPEQVKGLPITTSSDIYSLGVMLYQLLTGDLPYKFTANSPVEIERIISEKEPTLPSLNTNSKSRNPKSLKGDLDNIALMALRKEPSRRYTSVEEFSRDIERYLKGLPVIARQDTFAYRASKFVKRHRFGVGFAALLAILIISFAVYTKVQSNRIAKERDRAEKVAEFMREIFKSNDPSKSLGQTVTARELLKNGAEKIERELQNQPDVQSALMDTIGQVYESLGLYDDALQIFQKSLDIRKNFYGAESAEFAETMLHLGRVQRIKADYSNAKSNLEQTLHIRQNLFGNSSKEYIEVLREIIYLNQAQKDFPMAVENSQKVVELCRRIYGEANVEVSKALRDLSVSFLNIPDGDAAEKAAREAVEINRKIFSEPNQETIDSLNQLASVLAYNKREFEEAKSILDEALRMTRIIYGNEHPQVVEALKLQNWYFTSKEDYQGWKPVLLERLQLCRKIYGNEHPETSSVLNSLGASQFHLNELEDAEKSWNEALLIRRKVYGSAHPQLTFTISNLGLLKYEKRDYQGAVELFQQSIKILRQINQEKNAQMGHALIGLGKSLLAQGNAREAELPIRQGIEIVNSSIDKYSWSIAEAERILGNCLLELKRFDEAETLLLRSFNQIKTDKGMEHKSTQESIKYLVKLYDRTGQKEKAIEFKKLL